MAYKALISLQISVALLAEGVDRNICDRGVSHEIVVALLAEGVDRNDPCIRTLTLTLTVALLAEGVDRNSIFLILAGGQNVALLAEGVDRNISPKSRFTIIMLSPSSRRAWIEMFNLFKTG